MKEKIEEYIVQLDEAIKELELWLDEHVNYSDIVIANRIGRLKTLLDVKNDLQGRLNELV